MNEASVATAEPLRRVATARGFVCAWCCEAPRRAEPEATPTENFGICDGCLEERLRVLDRKASRRRD